MNVALKPKLRKFVEEQVKTGRYDTVGDVVAAALSRLMQDHHTREFAPGELRSLVIEGEADIARGDTLTLKQARRHFRRFGVRSRVSKRP